ncbi:dihydropteroate synthase [Arenicella sp. 4NH20-0111]|uniref:dihydropteroate synthase n=1 Tax=Arenicella sp. 4NH20-0111 TaxID=3127648 RepID=UPI0031040A58
MVGNLVRPLLRRKSAAIMGIINTTPDSFSDGGKYDSLDNAVRHGLRLSQEGADILDVGGESTRPGAEVVGVQEELDRVLPVIEKLVSCTDTPISIDTYKPKVMKAAVQAGAQMVNDVYGLRADNALSVVAQLSVPVCIMHMQGRPKTMQAEPNYTDVVSEVVGFCNQQVESSVEAGIARSDLLFDPGIGFGKTLAHNLLLLRNIDKIRSSTECEILIGVSKKSFIQKQLGREVADRVPASLGLAVQSVLSGAKIVRVHDVRATYDAIRMVEAVSDAK